MRLSNGVVNTRASASPVKAGARSATLIDDDWLRESSTPWPPLLPTFAEANNDAVASFIHLFITHRIQCKCGQCPQDQFVADFLTPWLKKARTRVVEIDGLITAGNVHLTPTQRTLYEGCVERLLSAIRDAQLEMPAASRPHGKTISFTHPIARRIVRHSSCDRLSLRSVTDDERSDASPSPIPSAASIVEWAVEEEETGIYTARTSGVYYGDVVHGGLASPSTNGSPTHDSEDDESPCSQRGMAAQDPLNCFALTRSGRYTHRRARPRRMRQCWLAIFYGVPAAALAVLVLVYWFSDLVASNDSSF